MSDDPHIIVTETDGTVTSLLLPPSGFNRIRKNPITGLGQVTTAGDNAERSDQRTPQVILTDQRGGEGEWRYTETQGLSTYTYSECDVRAGDLIVAPPALTQIAGGAVGVVDATPMYIEYVNVASCYVIVWAYGNASTASAFRATAAGGSWSVVLTGGTGVSNLTGFAYYRGYYLFATTTSTVGLYTSTDGVTWANSAKAKAARGICVHDNKVYIFNSTDNTLDWATDPTAAHASWAASSVLYLHPGETVRHVREWRNAGGRAVVYVVTTRRVLQYDEDADVFLDFYDLTRVVNPLTSFPDMLAAPSDGNAYLTRYDTTAGAPSDTVVQFSGTTTIMGPNMRRALPQAGLVNLSGGVGNTQGIYFSGIARSPNTLGRVMFLNGQGGWSCVTSLSAIRGIGYGAGNVFFATGGGTQVVYAISAPDSPESPLFVARTYAISQNYSHEYAFTDGGTPNMDKQWCWVAVSCLDHTSANKVPGLAATTQVIVQYRRDVDTAWTTLGTLTSADVTWPMVLPINSGNGVTAKQFKVRLLLSTTTVANTPVVASVALAYTRSEVPRYAYTVPLDLGDRAHPLYRGKDVAQLLAALDRWTLQGARVRLDFAGGDEASVPSTGRTVLNCTFAYSGEEDPSNGPQRYVGIFSSYQPPASG